MRWTTLAIMLACGTACQAQNRELRQAREFELAGLWSNAMDTYLSLPAKQAENASVIISLTRVGQHVLDDTLALFRKQVLGGERDAALLSYAGAVRVQQKLAERHVKLAIPEFDRADAERLQQEQAREQGEAERELKQSLYDEGSQALADQKYGDAERAFDRICQLDKTYRDACAMRLNAQAEGLYQQGVELQRQEHWCTAYRHFLEASKKVPEYRDTRSRMAQCRALGDLSLLVMPLNGDETTADITDWLHARILTRIIARQDPFLSVVDREELDVLMAEHRFCMSGLVESSCAIQAGEFKGADQVMIVNVKDLEEEDAGEDHWVRDGYEWYVTTHDVVDHYWRGPQGAIPIYRKEKVDHKDPVTYEEYQQERSVRLRLDFKVITVSTGTIVLTDSEVAEASDSMHYID
ncbi:MAG TPA: hypothetical protein VKG92_06510, partial [Flavobacteriales bacterium]|nr:hypothetical protein [Flavobacteriales bacterium]